MARHTRIAPLLVLALACATVGAGRAAAQTTTASVQGVVRDASGAVLPGASVTLRDVNTGFARATTSDRTGAYVLPFVPAGAYELTVDLSGFKTLKRERLQFDVGQESTIDATLEIASVAETVTVREQAPVVETTKSTVDQVIHRAQIDKHDEVRSDGTPDDQCRYTKQRAVSRAEPPFRWVDRFAKGYSRSSAD